MNVKRLDLINQLVEHKHYTKKAATQIIDDFMEIVLENLRNGDTVTLRNFGCFDILQRKARSCPNPITGETCYIPEHWVPRFYPSERMRRAVKEWEDDKNRGLI